MTFIIVTHLSPSRHSLLHEVLSRYTSMPINVAVDGARILDNNVYVMPEGKILTVRDGCLRLRDDDPVHRERKPIDVFFGSLAEDQGENAVAIVLSGGDSDGTLGVKAIKEHGGVTMAQASDGSAPRNPEMPHSAMRSGLIDFAVSVEHMPERLLQLRSGSEENREPATEAHQVQSEIAAILRSHTGHDFSGYKSKTFMRRVARRMKVVGLTGLDTYAQRLRDDPQEVSALFRDLLINVTNFFRDAEAFDALKALVIPQLFAGRGADEKIRIWVPACATGEEVYSLGILMREQMDGLEIVPKVQIFATDIDDEALAAARAGRYPESLLADVDSERLNRFFRPDGASYVVCKEVRDMCIFSPHSLISDPPFSRMDLVSCRNLLIYLGGELQNQAIPTFHYALKPGGFLFLGTSEGIGRNSDLFAPVDKQHRIFQSRDHGGPRRLPLAVDPSGPRLRQAAPEKNILDTTGLQLRQRVEMQVLERHAPAHVVITYDGEILYFSSNTGRYLEIPRGAPNRHFLQLARRELRADLRAALRQTMETGKPARRQVLMLEPDSETSSMITLTIEPLGGSGSSEALFLVLFTPQGHWQSQTVPAAPAGDEQEDEAAHHTEDQTEAEAVDNEAVEQGTQEALEQELRELRERMQTTIEEYETALEELKSANEELVSINEEAQSTNEELEASREEMQSLNEELSTINTELATSVEDLDRANADLKNLYAATQIATVFLDHDLVIRNFTPAAGKFFNIREVDIGRPLTDLAGSLQYPELKDEVRQVFSSGQELERRLNRGADGKHFLVRLVPYLDSHEGIDGVVVTLVDITSLADAEEHQKVLICELNHRVKNMLAVVISIANITRHSTSSLEDFADQLSGRLHGMARAYSLLSRVDWTEVAIRDLIETEAEAFGASQITAQGPDIALTPRQALSLSMIMHEIATNAVKYGALSSDAGRVNVSWRVEEGRVHLKWLESNGPTVQAPEQKGFGFVLIEGQVESQIGGEIEVKFPPEGVVVNLSFPLKS